MMKSIKTLFINDFLKNPARKNVGRKTDINDFSEDSRA